MYKPPFSRRLLPWLYAMIFLIVGPWLLLYTAGYRYNLKKHSVERNGALIIDGAPRGAAIFLDGVDSKQTLPHTFQHISPGWHNIRLEKPGYNTWEKRLEVRPEQVTFANHIRLWAREEINNVSRQRVTFLAADPTHKQLALLFEQASGTRIGLWDQRSQSIQGTTRIEHFLSTKPVMRWNQGSSALLINGLTDHDGPGWMMTQSSSQFERLPPGLYHWLDESTLVGSNDAVLTRIQTKSQRLTQQELPPGFVYKDLDISLQATGTPAVLLLTKKGLSDRVYQLSSLHWRPADKWTTWLIMKKKSEPAWMGLDLSQDRPYAGEAEGDYPRWWLNPDDNHRRRGLLIKDGELWLWEPPATAQLIWRQAEALRQVVWDQGGDHIILADGQRIWAMELDDRDGRRVAELARLSEIYDLALLEDKLYIAGRSQDGPGLWTLSLNKE